MNRVMLRLASIVIYLGALMILLGVRIGEVLSLKLMFTLAVGTLVLALPYYSSSLKQEEIAEIIGRKALDAGYIQTFILLFVYLSNNANIDTLFWNIAMSCRSLLYGYCIYILMDTRVHNEETFKKEKEDNKLEEVNEQEKLDKWQEEESKDVKCEKYWCAIGLSFEEVSEYFKNEGLTKRESELAYALFKGLSNREIAEQFYISETTVKKHISHIFEKLDIQKREAIKELVEKRFISKER